MPDNRSNAIPRARPGPPCRGIATALVRGQVPRAVAMPRPSRATCPVGGGSAAVKLPHCRQRITSRHLVKGTTTSMYCKPLACTPRTVKKATSVAIALPPRDQVPRAVAVPRPSRATCPVGGGSAAVKRPALPSTHHRLPPCKRHNHVDVLQASGLHPPHCQESDKRCHRCFSNLSSSY